MKTLLIESCSECPLHRKVERDRELLDECAHPESGAQLDSNGNGTWRFWTPEWPDPRPYKVIPEGCPLRNDSLQLHSFHTKRP